MSIRAALTDLAVPPVDLVYLGIIGLILRRRFRRAGRAVTAIALAGLLVFAVPSVGDALLVSLEHGVPLDPPAQAPPQAIVILSAESDPVRDPPGIEVGALTLQRLRAGALLWRRVHLPVLVSGGRLRPDEEPIAIAMARTLRQTFGVPVRWVEARSLNTWQNAADSAAMLEPDGIHSVYLVTHAWHERRSVLAFRQFGLILTAAPVQLDAISFDLLPSVLGWSETYIALHEWIGLAFYHLLAAIHREGHDTNAARETNAVRGWLRFRPDTT